ncbi:MAG: lipopolysaccharide biosynthesis protein [Oligoflexales bacterium]
MIQTQRLSKAIASGFGFEILQKIIPFLMISIARTRLGLENFGYAIFCLSVIESLIPWVVAGYNHAASVDINKKSFQIASIAQTVSNTQALKLMHSAILLLGLLTFTTTGWATNYHPTFFILIAVCLISTAFESHWLLVATQRVAWAHSLNGFSRFLCLILTFFLVNGAEDIHLLIFLWISPSILIHITTALWSIYTYGFKPPQVPSLPSFFTKATPYFWIIPLMTLLERVDVLCIEPLLGAEMSGLYGGPGRITHSLLQTLAAVGSAFFAEMLQVHSKKSLTQHLSLSLWFIALIIFPILIGTPFIASPLLKATIGENHPLAAQLFCFFNLGLLPSILIQVFGLQVLITRGEPQKFTKGLFLGIFSFFICLCISSIHWSVYNIFLSACIGKTVAAVHLYKQSLTHLDGPVYHDAIKVIPGCLLMGVILMAAKQSIPWWGLIGLGAACFMTIQLFVFKKQFIQLKSYNDSK